MKLGFKHPRSGINSGAYIDFDFAERKNLLKYSQDFSNTVWEKTSAGTGSEPITTADQIVFDLHGGITSGDVSQIGSIGVATKVGDVQTVSVWLRSDTPVTVLMQDNMGNESIKSITTEWVRYHITSTSEDYTGAGGGFSILLEGGVTSDSATLYARNAQLEFASSPGEYYPVTNKKTLIDYSGNGRHGILTTNYPKWTSQGLYFNGTYAVEFPSISLSEPFELTIQATGTEGEIINGITTTMADFSAMNTHIVRRDVNGDMYLDDVLIDNIVEFNTLGDSFIGTIAQITIFFL